jgi:hypothetical protein
MSFGFDIPDDLSDAFNNITKKSTTVQKADMLVKYALNDNEMLDELISKIDGFRAANKSTMKSVDDLSQLIDPFLEAFKNDILTKGDSINIDSQSLASYYNQAHTSPEILEARSASRASQKLMDEFLKFCGCP